MKYRIFCWLNDFWYQYLKPFASIILALAAHFFFVIGANRLACKCVLPALRYGSPRGAVALLRRCMGSGGLLHELVTHGVDCDEASSRSIIIKWPIYADGVIKKGVVLISFTRTFAYFLRNVALEKMAEHFVFVLEPSSSGYADPDILAFIGRVGHMVVETSELKDRIFMNSFPETFVPVSFGAGDWVDCSAFREIAVAKKYDSIYIANTHPVKRVKRYLDAVKKIVTGGAENYFACLVCASWGLGEELIRELVASYQLEKNIELKFSLSQEQVIEVLNCSKVNILLSFKEGSSRSLFESMFCGVPVICIGENVGVNKSYINEFTGLLVADEDLESSLFWMRDHYSEFGPRQWAIEYIAPTVTTQKLCHAISSRVLRCSSSEFGELLGKTNNPEVSYLDYPAVKHKDYSLMVLNLFALNAEHTVEGYTGKLIEIATLFENDINQHRRNLG